MAALASLYSKSKLGSQEALQLLQHILLYIVDARHKAKIRAEYSFNGKIR
jgi:hypothetical protein